MIQLTTRIWDFIKSDFNILQYGLVFVFIAVLIWINYFVIPIESKLINDLPGGLIRFSGYFILYSITYFVSLTITLSTKKKLLILKSPRFWIVSLSALLIFSLDAGFFLPQFILNRYNGASQTYSFYYSLISNGKGLVTISLLLLAINFTLLKNKNELLGVNRESDLKPFFVILLLIAPFIFLAAYNSGLGSYYPTFKYSQVGEIIKTLNWLPPIVYEFIYGIDFFNVELFFRGFMVIGLSGIMGKEVILPMAVFYCSIHFGKPFLECISSLFGGYLLGIIAFETRSILGGVILHIGVAWLMEAAAIIAK